MTFDGNRLLLHHTARQIMLCCRVVKEETGNAEWLWLDESTELTRGDVRHHPSSSTSLRNRLCCPVAMGEVRGDAGGHPRRHYVDTCATRSAYGKLAWMACWREPGGFTLSWGVSCGALTSALHEAHAWRGTCGRQPFGSLDEYPACGLRWRRRSIYLRPRVRHGT